MTKKNKIFVYNFSIWSRERERVKYMETLQGHSERYQPQNTLK